MSLQTTITPVKNLMDKDPILDRIFLVKDKNIGTGKNGKMFLTTLLADKTGQLDARLWDNVDMVSALFEIGDLVKVKGVVQIYNQKKQFVIHRLENAADLNLNKDDYFVES